MVVISNTVTTSKMVLSKELLPEITGVRGVLDYPERIIINVCKYNQHVTKPMVAKLASANISKITNIQGIEGSTSTHKVGCIEGAFVREWPCSTKT